MCIIVKHGKPRVFLVRKPSKIDCFHFKKSIQLKPIFLHVKMLVYFLCLCPLF